MATGYGQCPQVYDGTGQASSNPYWISCTGGAYTLNFSSPTAVGSYTVVWGDGSANTTGGSLGANTIITHNYSATIDTFVVSFITTAPSCTLTGVVVMEKPVNASIQIPVGGVTAACAPAILQFINSSTNVSQTTTFTWDFGDGSPIATYNYTNGGQTIFHQYNKGTVNCQTVVTLTAQNYCTFGSPTTAQFNPIQIYDIDQAAITPDASTKCWPDNAFTYTNTTTRNCFSQGNNGIRYEKWNFGDYWGLGHDSIINWTAWPPTFPKTIAYPNIGCYNVMLYDSNQCGIDTATITVCIVSKPTAGLTGLDTVCFGTPMTFTNTSTTGVSYQWNFGNNGTYTNTNYNPQTHNYGSPGTYTVSVVAYVSGAANSCKDTARKVVTVLPAPTANFTYTPTTGCNSVTVNFTDASVNAVSWQWNFGNGNSFTGQNPPTQTYTNTGIYTVSQTVTSSNGCTATKVRTVNVYETPVAQFTTSVACANNTVQFTDQSTHAFGDNILVWKWDFGDGSAFNSQQNPGHIYAAAGTYTVVLNVATAHCSDSVVVPVVVNPLPVPAFTFSPASGCPSLVVSFTNTSTGATSYNWVFGNGSTSSSMNPSATYSNSTTSTINYIVTLMAASAVGCKDSLRDTVVVFGKPIASFTSNAAAACAPFNVTFNNTSQAAVTYLWDFGDGSATSSTTSPSHLYQNTTNFLQNYTVTLHVTNAGGCQDSVKQVIQAYPTAQFTFSATPDSGCGPLSINFPAAAGAVLYQWNFGDGSPPSTGINPLHTYTNTTSSTVYTVQLIAVNAFNCSDTVYQTVSVFSKPVASFSISVDSGCSPLPVNFTDLSTGATTYSWNFGDGANSTLQNPTHTFTTSSLALDSFLVTLISHSIHGCTDTMTKRVYVFPKVTAGFTSDTLGCSPLNVSFANSTAGANTYTWNYGDGSPTSASTNTTHIYVNTSTVVNTYTATLFAYNSFGCGDTAQQKITVLPKPTASFTLNTTSGCTPLPVSFTDLSTGATLYSWNFGDGGSSALQNVNHIYTSSSLALDSFLVTFIASNSFGCSDTVTKEVYVFPKVTAGFTSDTLGCSPLNVAFINSTQGATTYTWNYGDGSPTSAVTNPTHIYVNTSAVVNTYTATLFAYNSFGCGDTVQQKITVLPKPTASFTLSSTTGCPAFTPTFTNTSTGANAYNWNFGDGTTSTNIFPAHTYTNTSYVSVDSFNIQLIVSNAFNCTDTAYQLVHVYPQILANFYADTPICAPVNVVFHNLTQSTPTTGYNWNFGDGSPPDNSAAPSHLYTNTTGVPAFYTVTLTATNAYGCTSSYSHTYAVYPTPTASFTISPATQTYPATTVTITNQTPNAGSFANSWNFGDGTTSNLPNPPNHIYSTWGTYTISLVVSSAFCKDSTTQVEVIIPPKPVASFTGCKKGCVPLRDSLHNTSLYATSYYWDFGDNLGVSSIQNPVYIYSQPGIYDIKLVVTGPGGKDSVTQKGCAEVYPLPKALFTLQPTSLSVSAGTDPIVCANISTINPNLVPPETISSYIWDFGDGTATVTATNPSHIYQQAGQYAVSLIAISNRGCRDTLTYYPLVTVTEEVTIQVPNAFTPNPNGSSGGGVYDPASHENDIFHPNVTGLQTYELDIFNRWGELIFVSKDTKVGWDGYYKGKLCEQSIYVWKIKGTSFDGRTINKAGDLTLLR